MKRELIPIVDPNLSPITVKGFAEREWAERNNLTHLTTLIIPVRSDKHVQMQIRPRPKTYPGCRDFFGGHVTIAEFMSCLLGAMFDLVTIVTRAAVREANEELRLHSSVGRLPLDIREAELVQVDGVGEFTCEIEGNRERSTLFLFPIPQDCELTPMDDHEGRFMSVETEFCPFEEVIGAYQKHPQNGAARTADYDTNKREWQFADGAGRILANASLAARVREAIDSLSENSFKPRRHQD